MTFISWATFHEGSTDGAYLEVLIPRILEDIVMSRARRSLDIPATPAVQLGKNGRDVEQVAAEICEARDAFEIVFIHADTGGRALERGLHHRSTSYCRRAAELCDWPAARCVTVAPRHETEAWILADSTAIAAALGFKGDVTTLSLPADAGAAERLPDPKGVLAEVLRQIAGPRRRRALVEQLFPAIAQRQSLDALRASASFRTFEGSLIACLLDMRCIH